MVWIKICGITNLEDARTVSRLKVDAMGFILSTDSPRRVELAVAKKIVKELYNEEDRISTVGVFVNEKIENILEGSESLGLDYVQLSGDEDRDFIKNLKTRCGEVKIIKSIRIKNKNKHNSDYKAEKVKIGKIIENLKGYADFILLDSYRKDTYGGTGETFNWEMIRNYNSKIPVILSGGLNPGNVRLAVNMVKPFGVDASSGLEIYPGKKDPEKVKQFINNIR